MTRRVTMADVARHAQVGSATVSRVLRQPGIVAEPTRRRVQRAIDELNYVPDMIAGSLASNRTGIVAMIVPTIAGSVFAETVEGAAAVLRAQGHELLLGNSGYDDDEEENLVRALLGRRPDGVILTGARHTAATRAMLSQANVPVVETWELPDDPIDSAVGFDNRAAARAMIERLYALGHRRIAMIAQPPADRTRNAYRIAGYRDVVRARNLAEDLFFSNDEVSALRAGALAMAAVLAHRPSIDAVFCADDNRAAGALFECTRRAVSVPGDIAVAGFGDFDIAHETAPTLTTIRVPGAEIGRRAAETILACLAGQRPPENGQDLGFELIARESA